ncbi:MAG: cysS2 [Nitrososphaeraceae archaeon]|jgi:cysteinyl-tRNA synthetase|nr:cysS2 [Nitrososphaeraceae archaeon]
MYVCGVTVYDDSHIGHARTIIFFDVLRRYLLFKGYKIQYIQNFTDIDDKIINKAKEVGTEAEKVANLYINNYFSDFTSLNVLQADRYPLATEHIQDIIAFVENLLEKGYAYVSTHGVYFHVRSFDKYGKLSKKTTEELESGSRIEIDPLKRDPLDFALWKFYSDEPNWISPWGRGRPGWHIECSVMASKYLGDLFDIHGGGNDLIFPHHENEIAQCESYSGKEMARYWLHVGMVSINGEKMSKSIGNIISVAEARRRWGANALRIYCISAHYSKPLDFSDTSIMVCLQRWRQVEVCAFELRFAVGESGKTEEIKRLCRESIDAFKLALEDDMNTALALSVFMNFINHINRFAANEELTKEMAKVAIIEFNNFLNILGLRVAEPTQEEIFRIESLLKERSSLRREFRFAESDKIRKILSDEFSVRLIDHKARTIWMKIEDPH